MPKALNHRNWLAVYFNLLALNISQFSPKIDYLKMPCEIIYHLTKYMRGKT